MSHQIRAYTHAHDAVDTTATTMSSLNFKLIRLGSCLHDQWLKEKTLFQTRLNAERHADELLDCDEVSAGDFLDHLLDVHRRMCRVCSCSTTSS